jgi:CheY-like chemotaxis protein
VTEKEKDMTDEPLLLVEDNADDEMLILRSLKSHNLANNVIVARDGAEALDYIFGTGGREADGPLKPVVVLLDIKLPKVDGLEVLERIRSDERTKQIPVVMLTSSNEERDVARSYQLGINSYVRKPVEFKAFSEAVSQLGLYWMILNEPPPKQP